MSHLIAISTSPGAYTISQKEMETFFQEKITNVQSLRKYRALMRDKSIEAKHCILPDFSKNTNKTSLYYHNKPDPDTAQRMKLFKKEALKLASKVCLDVLKKSKTKIQEITHIISITCTGISAPGLEIELIQKLGLASTTQRHAVNFMGCYAAFHGFKLADMICKTNENAKVLLVSVELCSLHFRSDESDDNLLSTYLFSDGAAACIFSADKPKESPSLRMIDFASLLVADAKEEMSWNVGNTGFEMQLSKSIPRHLESHLKAAFDALIKNNNTSPIQIKHFAIHPGGKNILKAFEKALNISETKLKESYHVLLNFGNMSSASVIFVLNHILNNPTSNEGLVYAAAFGPGLTIESGLFYLE